MLTQILRCLCNEWAEDAVMIILNIPNDFTVTLRINFPYDELRHSQLTES